MTFKTPEELLHLPEGTAVLVIESYYDFRKGDVIYRKASSGDDLGCVMFSRFPDGTGNTDYMNYQEVERLEEPTTNSTICAGRVCTDFSAHMELFQPEGSIIEQTEAKLGVFRPELGTRKIGKIRVELVDEGFPLALREVANVMTWAQTAKGYKDHDWQNLPNAEVALAAAASRHRTDHIKQRVVDGLDIDECVDVESGLLHKAHEAFGVLAQLELMLRGKFVDSRPQIGV